MKNSILILALIFCSCSKKADDPAPVTPPVVEHNVQMTIMSADSTRLLYSVAAGHRNVSFYEQRFTKDTATFTVVLQSKDTLFVTCGIQGKQNNCSVKINVPDANWSTIIVNNTMQSKGYMYIYP